MGCLNLVEAVCSFYGGTVFSLGSKAPAAAPPPGSHLTMQPSHLNTVQTARGDVVRVAPFSRLWLECALHVAKGQDTHSWIAGEREGRSSFVWFGPPVVCCCFSCFFPPCFVIFWSSLGRYTLFSPFFCNRLQENDDVSKDNLGCNV